MAGEQDHAVLLANPRVDAVLKVIDPHDDIALHYPAAAMIAWCRFDIPLRARRADAFAGLYELPQREAELALALADGLSIAEAATAMNLTLETARNYSKRLYAKLDVSGQAQLVRLVHRSGAILA
jgi:DNA-binding CsgD family transcriptional regulator